ncbi:hypothetical protein CR194_19830 [Salipaludibacillus keqinensis]|uniref:YaaC-like Protein n=1 Tax=Salipaludibacillus keqinensis TaxID=2045207 RepID=A0A323TAA3_9BACI|nr:YaaC family protein [Salipaludibacillus keqinensis]PYZ91504.1 hypothetical protein CR194_19830 [Salipaludibacillus keqinensis]
MNQVPSFTSIFQSASYTRSYLMKKYELQSINNSSEKAYHNSYTFVYYIQIGHHYFQQGMKSPVPIKPVLLFYGLSHWLKAALLTVDPDYPATTHVLAHGLSTRKRKKQGYQFLSDEIRLQKNGLFPYLSEKLFHVKQLAGDKRTMRQLLFGLPEMQTIMRVLLKDEGLIHLKRMDNGKFSVTKKDLSQWDGPLSSWVRHLSHDAKGELTWEETCNEVQLTFLPRPVNDSLSFRTSVDFELFAPKNRSYIINLPELLVHYALLYSLSMICRYEAEWWGELIHSFSADDLPIITEYLDVSQTKCPWLLNRLFL